MIRRESVIIEKDTGRCYVRVNGKWYTPVEGNSIDPKTLNKLRFILDPRSSVLLVQLDETGTSPVGFWEITNAPEEVEYELWLKSANIGDMEK